MVREVAVRGRFESGWDSKGEEDERKREGWAFPENSG